MTSATENAQSSLRGYTRIEVTGTTFHNCKVPERWPLVLCTILKTRIENTIFLPSLFSKQSDSFRVLAQNITIAFQGIVNLMDHSLTCPQYIASMIFLNTPYRIVSHIVSLKLTMPVKLQLERAVGDPPLALE